MPLVVKMLHIIISRWKDQGLLSEKLSESDFHSPANKIASSIYSEYQKQMHDSNALDFGDLLLYCNQILIQNPGILEYYDVQLL